MGSSEKFCLRWNDFATNVSGTFRELREEEDFFDITLACEDDQIKAHKVILSACSPFFRTVLKRNRHEHPLLYLKGVKFSELQAVLNFMYQGEVNVAQEDLNSFLAVAEELKVKGLTQSHTEPASPPPPPHKQTRSRDDKDSLQPPPAKRGRPPNSAVNNKPPKVVYEPPSPVPAEASAAAEVMPSPHNVKSEPVASGEVHAMTPAEPFVNVPAAAPEALVEYGDDYGVDYESGGGYEAEGSYDESMMDNSLGTPSADGNKEIFEKITFPLIRSTIDEVEGKMWVCVRCNKRSKNRTNIQNHAEVVHSGEDPERYACHVCLLRKGTFKAVWKHVYRAHREVLAKNQQDNIVIS